MKTRYLSPVAGLLALGAAATSQAETYVSVAGREYTPTNFPAGYEARVAENLAGQLVLRPLPPKTRADIYLAPTATNGTPLLILRGSFERQGFTVGTNDLETTVEVPVQELSRTSRVEPTGRALRVTEEATYAPKGSNYLFEANGKSFLLTKVRHNGTDYYVLLAPEKAEIEDGKARLTGNYGVLVPGILVDTAAEQRQAQAEKARLKLISEQEEKARQEAARRAANTVRPIQGKVRAR